MLDFSAADLAASAAAYDPAKHEAPIVVGHPTVDAPAYGWVKALAYADAALEARPDQVDPAFAEMVSAGRFKKISASFYAPDAPGNPVPGVYYLRHVGFLGATAPSVKGLRNPSFAADESGVIEFGDYDDQVNSSLWRSLRDWLLVKFGQEDADHAIPSYNVSSLEASAAQPDDQDCSAGGLIPAFASPTKETLVTPEQKAALEAENVVLKNRVAENEARDKLNAATARHTANLAFAETLATDGKLLPAQKDVAVATLDFLAAQDTPVEFGERDAKKPLVDAFKEFLAALPKQVEFGEAATRERADGGAATVEFAAPTGFGVDGEAAARHRKALAYQAQHKTDYLTAIRAIS